MDDNKLWKILKEMDIPDHLICLLRNLYVGQETTESDMEQLTGPKLGEKYKRAVYCHPAYLKYAEYISWAEGSTSWNQDCQEKYQ